uniref:VirB9 n=1 Tax=Aliarcobacter butzleri TaxID=28197 RepID=W0LZX5_9BACT|nr:TrbG/VirB9 family P-type conjugative transfer protein [Aliarcobacter butzleri]AHG28757.1 VirB9 [Aliarcobacter butzleri]
MKIISILLILVISLFSNESLFVDDGTQQAQDSQSFETEIDYTKDMKSIQNVLKDGQDIRMIENIKYEPNKTYKIPLRQFISTYFIFDNDKIAFHDTGDNVSFKTEVLGRGKYDFSSVLRVTPKFIGVDTNLTVFGESGNVYNFYIYSTNHESNIQPKSLVHISEEKTAIEKIEVVNLEQKKVEEAHLQQKAKEQLLTPNGFGDVAEQLEYATIGEGINQIKIKRNEIIQDFVQEGKDKSLYAGEIFRDSKFVYFKFNSKDGLVKFPIIYRVIEGIDNPINTRVVGNYIIAETISNSFTLRFGDNNHVCVRRLKDI